MNPTEQILIQLDDGRVFAATVLSVHSGGLVARPLGSQRVLALRPDQCAPLKDAFEAFTVLPVVKQLLSSADAELERHIHYREMLVRELGTDDMAVLIARLSAPRPVATLAENGVAEPMVSPVPESIAQEVLQLAGQPAPATETSSVTPAP